jgi:F0F1-type ATP synthase assembly protein I
MRINLKEEPRAWRNFMLQVCGIMAGLVSWLGWRGQLGQTATGGLLGVILLVSLLAVVCPAWFRIFYRAGMRVSSWLGERMGRIVLTVFFFVVICPLGWVLRLTGYDPLFFRRQPGVKSYWRPVGKSGGLDRLY